MSKQDKDTSARIRDEILAIVSRAKTSLARREIEQRFSTSIRKAAGVLPKEPVQLSHYLKVLVESKFLTPEGAGRTTRYSMGPAASRECPEQCPTHGRTCQITTVHVGRHRCPLGHYWST